MPDVEPTGNRVKAKSNLRDVIAESATFQTAVGATGEAEEKIAAAKLRIHRTAYAPVDFERPFALICSVGNDKSENDAVSQFTYCGDIELRFEKDIDEDYTAQPENAEVEFENFYETVMDEVMALSIQPGYFAINSWDIIEGPTQYEIAEGVFVYGVRLLINWGI